MGVEQLPASKLFFFIEAVIMPMTVINNTTLLLVPVLLKM